MIKIEELQSVLRTVTIDPATREEIIKKAEQLEEEKKADKIPAAKASNSKQWIVVLKAPMQIDVTDVVAHVFQMGDEEDAGTLITRVKESAVEHNLATKKRSNLVETFDDVGHIKSKQLKNKGVALKSKQDWARVFMLPENVKFGGFEKTNE